MRRLIVGNWKMNKTVAATQAFVAAFLRELDTLPPDVDIAIAPPFTALEAAGRALRGSRVALSAQNVASEPNGAFTGEIAANMLTELGVTSVILGHSERRRYFGETDQGVNKKARAALAAGLTPIVCVGESSQRRDAGDADAFVGAQTRAALDGIAPGDLSKVVLAYEPLWAIGTGKNCEPAQADATMAAIRASVDGLAHVRILYGGSVTPANVASYSDQPNVGGGLIGGASLDPVAFAELIRAAHPGNRA
ncbi:MAG TPA: triose-phosphate isomerase [Candidatus Baltobacteraceae bacterium]